MTDDANEPLDQDPGWHVSRRTLFLILPGMLQRDMRRTPDALQSIRDLFSAFVSAIVLFGVVLIFIPPYDGPTSALALVSLLVVAIVCVVMPSVIERPLDCTSDQTLAGGYRTRFFLRMAFAEAIALFGFVLYFIAGPRWIYYVAAVVTLARMAQAAPTPAALQRDQDELNTQGCSRSLVAALRRVRPT